MAAKYLSHPSGGAFTFCVHGRQRQAQQHFIFNQFNKTQGLADQNRIAIGQRIQPFELGLVARQIHHAIDLDPMPHAAQTPLTRQIHLTMNCQLQGQATQLIRPSFYSTEQRALRKFMGKSRELRHVRLGFPRLRIPAKTPWIDLNSPQHGSPNEQRTGVTRTDPT